ncbi:hypothetical protein OJAV_G00114670 [Oryzias javanicus]|uniref:UPAR/Ly6 domain-containing protein n=1 Tax=Oryzias javanicus TaxID=123683 RepID=A0A3S2P8E9_ORYJA|nr:hypothetical protein OJAV_G00114670 [Oryzias javanicus]
MNKLLFLFAVGVCFALGQTLECYQCSLGLWNLCITTKTTCNSGEHCFSGLGKAAGFVDIKTKGCLAVEKCNMTENQNFGVNTTLYKLTKTCCNTNLCNGAPRLPGGAGLSLAAAVVSALITARVLV